MASHEDGGLHRKLVWLTFFRLAMVSVLLGGTAIVVWGESADVLQGLTPLFALAASAFAASVAFAVVLRTGRADVPLAYAQVLLDVGLATVVAWVSGRAESVFVFLYSLAVVNGAILLFTRGAVAAALLSVAAYLLLNAQALGAPPVKASLLFTHGAAFAATAALASYLAEQLRSAGEQLRSTGERLAEIRALHGAVVTSMTSGLVTLDAEGRVTFLNRSATQLLALPEGEAIGRPAGEVLPPFRESPERLELDFTNRDGARYWLGYSSFPLGTEGGRPLGRAVIFQDLTRLRAAEEAVQRGKRLADLGSVAAGLAHEIRNPLASMSGSVEMLRRSPAAGEDERRLLGIVLREAERLNELVTQFLAFARPAPPRPRPTDLAALLDETLQVFRNDPQAAGLRVESSLDPAIVDADPDQLKQVAWNLLSNAAQAIGVPPAPGRGTIRVRCAPGDDGAEFEVADDGVGMGEEERSRIFLPFFTTKAKGTGLGLATVHRIVDAHGGFIRVESAPGAGSRFTVALPGPAGRG